MLSTRNSLLHASASGCSLTPQVVPGPADCRLPVDSPSWARYESFVYLLAAVVILLRGIRSCRVEMLKSTARDWYIPGARRFRPLCNQLKTSVTSHPSRVRGLGICSGLSTRPLESCLGAGGWGRSDLSDFWQRRHLHHCRCIVSKGREI